ncbi:MAG: UMP kinase [bacterium]
MKTILLKISGEIFNTQKASSTDGAFSLNKDLIKNIAKQIKELQKKYNIGIVIGGGNIFRGGINGKQLEITQTTSHQIGMLATIINATLFKSFLENEKIKCSHLCSFYCPQITKIINQNNIDEALTKKECIIFSGGTGNPFFTTDTTATLRALQINADIVLKATKVDGIFDSDPEKNKNAKLIKKISFDDFIKNNLKVIDLTAITLAKENNLKIKIFNLFENNSIIKAVKEKNFGSLIEKE